MTRLRLSRPEPPSAPLPAKPVPAPPAPAAGPAARGELAHFGLIAAVCGLLVLLIRSFELESTRFGDVAVLMWVGFVIHHFLPPRLRLPFFALLSLAAVEVVARVTVAGRVAGVGLAVGGVCHLPSGV